ATELLSIAAGIDVVHVPYKGSVAAVTDLLAGNVAFMFDSMQSQMPQVRAGKLRAVAYAGEKRSKAAPEIPTIAESGYKGVIAGSWYGLLGPAGLPRTVVN